jgi:hypothetical protein
VKYPAPQQQMSSARLKSILRELPSPPFVACRFFGAAAKDFLEAVLSVILNSP